MASQELQFRESNELFDMSLEGEIVNAEIHTTNQKLSTLDEPVSQTIMRDLKAIGQKFLHVLYPRTSSSLLKDWDLWGPLILCTTMAIILQNRSDDPNKPDSASGPEFAEIFVLFWLGSILVTLNTKLLGGDISILQSVCVLGYCALPLVAALLICSVIIFLEQNHILFFIRLLLVLLAFSWSTFASTAFLTGAQLLNRKALAIYPIGLFYFVFGWLILSHNSVHA